MMLRRVTPAAAVCAAAFAAAAFAGLAGSKPVADPAEIATLQMRAGPGHDESAARALERAAEAGSGPARLAFGQLLAERGDVNGVARSIVWLKKASGQGEMQAELTLGKLYLKGAPGLPAAPALAAPHFERAASGGVAGAAYYLGLMYRNGNGVKRDSTKAATLLDAAARGGVPSAMFILANMYLAGEGVQQDKARAREWLEKAAELDHPESNQMLAMGMRDGSLGVPADDRKAALQLMEAAHSLKHRPVDP